MYCKNGPKGPGYYHLLIRVSYVNLFNCLASEAPSAGSCSGAAAHKELIDYDTVKTIVYKHSVSTKPDDAHARQEVLENAQALLDRFENGTPLPEHKFFHRQNDEVHRRKYVHDF